MTDRATPQLVTDTPRRPATSSASWLRCAAILLCAFPGLVEAATATPKEVDAGVIDALARSMSVEIDKNDHFDAQVWLLSSVPKLARYVANDDEQQLILRSVYREANRNAMDPDLVLAVMQVESRFDQFAVSKAGAQGLMQVMPFWRYEIGRPQDNLTQIETNVRYGAAILGHYLRVSRNDLIDALARYNGSRGRLNYPELVIYAYRARWQTQTTDDLPTLRAGCSAYGLAACGPITKGR
ncbi:MAG TPA: lytic transglycosylase domain-containing protein [Pseudomonadales bacterium]